jgi:DNA-binding NarL/FixJ family response regulator
MVFGSGLLLDAGIANLLSLEPDMEIVDLSADETTGIVEQIERFQPDVVVLDEITYQAGETGLLAFLERSSEPRVVIVSADSNLLFIYEGHQVPIKEATDLVDAVRRLRERP